KGIQRQRFQADLGAGLNHDSDWINASLVAHDAGIISLPGPAAVSVHDDRDVGRNTFRIQLRRNFPIALPAREHLKQFLHNVKFYSTRRRYLIAGTNDSRNLRALCIDGYLEKSGDTPADRIPRRFGRQPGVSPIFLYRKWAGEFDRAKRAKIGG